MSQIPLESHELEKDTLRRKRINFANSILEIEYQGAAAERVINFIFKNVLETDSAQEVKADAQFTYRLESGAADDRLQLSANGEPERGYQSEAEAASSLVEKVCYQLAYFSTGGLIIHAGLVSHLGQGVLLPGASGNGKSTITAWMLHCGYEYSTDELVYLSTDDLPFGRGFARPINIKKAARQLMMDIFPIAVDPAGMMRTASIDLILPEMFGAGGVASHVPIRSMIFPIYTAGAAFELRKISKARASLELMQCLINARNLPEHGFPTVIQVASEIPAYKMIYSDFAEIEDTVNSIMT
jgi:hypothetical protein